MVNTKVSYFKRLVLATFIKRSSRQEEIFRVHLLEDPSIKLLYQRRLEQNLMYSPCSLNINVEWQTSENALQQAANEDLGKRKKRRYKRLLIFMEWGY
jgi:hypothetical protein